MIIVMRTDLNMRKGKMCAQSGHAVLGAYLAAERSAPQTVSDWEWEGQTKICVGVTTLEELLYIADKAKVAKLPHYVVTDSGKTEFKEPTVTCLAIGPAKSEDIDKITGMLRLL